MKVDQLPVDPGPAAWNAILPAVAARAELTEHRRADWLVIGGGFAGLSAARRLRELHPQDKIVLLEACRIAEGPAGRNSGFMIDVPHDLTASNYSSDSSAETRMFEATRREIRLNRAAIDYALQAREVFSMPAEAIALSGKINGAMSRRGELHNAAYATFLDRLGEHFEHLDAQQMSDITGTHCYSNGILSPGTAILQPALYVRELAEGIEKAGVRCYESSPATSIVSNGGDWRVKTPKGSIQSPRVLLTVNGHLQSFGYFRQHLAHVFTYGSMTRRLTAAEVKSLGGQASWALTPADALGTTVRRTSGTGGERIVIRNRATYEPSLQLKADGARLASVAQTHQNSFQARFPMLGNVEMDYCWGGRLCIALNGGTVFGEIESGLFAACCQNGLGTAKGTIGGKLIADLASGEDSALLHDQQAQQEPGKLPPEPLARLGAAARLRWGEWRAGREL